MPMELDCRELKSRVRQYMGAARPAFWLVTLVFLLLTTGVSTAADLSGATVFSLPLSGGDTLPLFLFLLIELYTTVMSFGYRWWALKTYRQQPAGFNTLIDGFSLAGRVLLLELMILICVAAWVMVLSFALLFVSPFLVMLIPPFWASLLELAALLLTALFLSYRYALAPYLLMDDPYAGSLSALRKSVRLMRGWKRQMFRLDLSFLGWDALAILLPLGIEVVCALPDYLELLGMPNVNPALLMVGPALPLEAIILSSLASIAVSLWLTPYHTTAQAGFYQIRVEHTDSPVWDSHQGPYDGPYNGPEL